MATTVDNGHNRAYIECTETQTEDHDMNIQKIAADAIDRALNEDYEDALTILTLQRMGVDIDDDDATDSAMATVAYDNTMNAVAHELIKAMIKNLQSGG